VNILENGNIVIFSKSFNGLGEEIIITKEELKTSVVGTKWAATEINNCGRDCRKEFLEVLEVTPSRIKLEKRIWRTEDSPNPETWETKKIISYSKVRETR
jgi:hypothetical protein